MARALRIWLLLALGAGAAMLLALSSGGSLVGWADVARLLLAPDASPASEVLHGLRLPRALAAFGTGGLLALAGALMQVLLRNPLADPYVLGVSGGAAVGALAAMLLGFGALLVQLGAFGGALLAIVLVFAIAHRDLARLTAAGSQDSAPRLLLTGVMLAAGWAALVTLMLSLAPEARLRGMLFWLTGDLSGTDAGAWPLVVLALLVLATLPLARDLNVLLRGPAAALTLGVRVVALRRAVYVLASLACAVAVTTSGSVGFIGLVVPHALRLLLGNDQRVLLPACALAGGALLLLADTAARSLVAPQQLPVGVITALVGVPTFLVLLLRSRAGR
ncbi:MAG: iron ABC transporter permease [Rubrivivax sp.]|nr:iron ABC transporter permease [Rubrivivax sp.]